MCTVVRPSRFLDQLLVVLLTLDALQAVRILLLPLDHALGDAGCQVGRPRGCPPDPKGGSQGAVCVGCGGHR